MRSIIPITAFNDNYIWCIIHSPTRRCVIVDPGEAEPVLQTLSQRQLSLTAILITHHHFDHTGGILKILQQFPVPVYGPKKETIPGLTQALDETHPPLLLDAIELHLKIFDIPGHTRGHIAYYGERLLFCGDTLFTGGCGRLFEGTAAQMYHSLAKLAGLPEETQVFCAHEYTAQNLAFAQQVEPDNQALLERIEQTKCLRERDQPTVPSTLAIEKLTNPFLRCQRHTVKQAVQAYTDKPLEQAVDVFAALRTWKDSFRFRPVNSK